MLECECCNTEVEAEDTAECEVCGTLCIECLRDIAKEADWEHTDTYEYASHFITEDEDEDVKLCPTCLLESHE